MSDRPEVNGRGRFPRRDFFKAGAVGLAALGLRGPAAGADDGGDAVGPVDLTVDRVDVIPVRVPFREVPARNMARELPHWDYFEIARVRLRSGHVGHGESMAFYTWGRTEPDDI